LTLHKHGELLYDGVSRTIREHLLTEAAGLKAVPDALLLQRLKQSWDAHSRDIYRIRDILMYMERSYVVNNRKLGTVDLGTTLFRDCVLRNDAIQPRVQRLLLTSMRSARDGELVEPLLIRHVLSLLVDLGLGTTTVYIEEFERPFLEQTEAFYREESADVLSRNNSTVEYLKYAERRLSEELSRADALMHVVSAQRLVDLIQRQLIAAHALRLVDVRVARRLRPLTW
jgi:cullin 3